MNQSMTYPAITICRYPSYKPAVLQVSSNTLPEYRPSYNLIFLRPCIMNWLYINYQLDAWIRGELSYLAPLGSEKISAPYFKQCFFWGGLPPRQSNTTPPSPKTEITNILFCILNLWLQIYCSGLWGCDMREKEIVIWLCWCFMTDIIFTLLSFLLCL